MPGDRIVTVGKCSIELIRGDITRIAVDAIVNAANSALSGGGGVDGAIHQAGGPSLMQELSRYQGCATGSAVITGGGRLPARYVIHAVGPIYDNGKHGEAELLASCYQIALRLAEENGCRSISFPNISTGVYGYPPAEAAPIALNTLARHVASTPGIQAIKLVQFSDASYYTYAELFSSVGLYQSSAQTS